MTWHFVPEDGTVDIWDHEGTQVATDRPFGTDDDDSNGSWRGSYPDEILVVMREQMDGSQPSAYNQSLLADAATDNIVEGPP